VESASHSRRKWARDFRGMKRETKKKRISKRIVTLNKSPVSVGELKSKSGLQRNLFRADKS
jgi:hypothetical protein